MLILEREKWTKKNLKQNTEGFPIGSHLNTLLKTNELLISHKYAKESI